MKEATQKTAVSVINAIELQYKENPNGLDFYASQHLSGENRKELRQHVMHLITGNERPASKCSVFAIATHLKHYFSQPKLF